MSRSERDRRFALRLSGLQGWTASPTASAWDWTPWARSKGRERTRSMREKAIPPWRGPMILGLAPLLALLTGCSAPTKPVVAVEEAPQSFEALYQPREVIPCALEYAPDRSTFPPVLTERFPYPTQPQANAAWLRLVAEASPDLAYPAAIRLFGCRPGALDEETARVTRYRGPVVHCATDLLDADGRRLRREIANFYYDHAKWNMQLVHPPLSIVSWRNLERSPADTWRWLPWRPRYE